MKRTTALTAFVAAGVLLLAGCGKDTGTATPVSDTAGAVTSQDAGASAGGDSTDSTDSSDAGSAGGDSTDSSDAGSAGGDSTDSTDSSDAGSAGRDSTDSSDAGSADQTTIGSGGDLDETSTAWFSTFCEGMAPVAGMKDIQSQLDTSDPKKMFKTLGDAMTKMGSAFSDSASKLKGMPAPTFDGGKDFADKIESSFSELGPKFTELGKKFATADPSDPSSMSDISSIGTDLQDAMKPLQEMQNLKIDSATQAAIADIPACKKLNS